MRGVPSVSGEVHPIFRPKGDEDETQHREHDGRHGCMRGTRASGVKGDRRKGHVRIAPADATGGEVRADCEGLRRGAVGEVEARVERSRLESGR